VQRAAAFVFALDAVVPVELRGIQFAMHHKGLGGAGKQLLVVGYGDALIAEQVNGEHKAEECGRKERYSAQIVVILHGMQSKKRRPEKMSE
jgi:hypothetical protein